MPACSNAWFISFQMVLLWATSIEITDLKYAGLSNKNSHSFQGLGRDFQKNSSFLLHPHIAVISAIPQAPWEFSLAITVLMFYPIPRLERYQLFRMKSVPMRNRVKLSTTLHRMWSFILQASVASTQTSIFSLFMKKFFYFKQFSAEFCMSIFSIIFHGMFVVLAGP